MAIALSHVLHRYRWLITFLLLVLVAMVLVAIAALVLGPMSSHGSVADLGSRTLSF